MNVYAGCFQVYRWKGRVAYDGNNCAMPYFFLANTTEDRLEDLKLVTIPFKSSEPKMKFCFLNQICGSPPDIKGHYYEDVVNDIDGCLQCSKHVLLHNMLGVMNISLLTVNVDTNMHVDKNDRWQKEEANKVVEELVAVMDTVKPGSNAHTNASNHLQFVSEFGVSVPTTCCYQFPSDNPNIVVLQAFVFPYLHMCLRIHHLMTHQFYTGLVQHATCVPVFYDKSNDVVKHKNSTFN